MPSIVGPDLWTHVKINSKTSPWKIYLLVPGIPIKSHLSSIPTSQLSLVEPSHVSQITHLNLEFWNHNRIQKFMCIPWPGRCASNLNTFHHNFLYPFEHFSSLWITHKKIIWRFRCFQKSQIQKKKIIICTDALVHTINHCMLMHGFHPPCTRFGNWYMIVHQ